MADPPTPPAVQSRSVSPRKTRLSLVWIVPIIAAIAGIWITATRILGEGPKIKLEFKTADGLEAGKTKIQFNGVEVGTITTVRLSQDHQRVIAMAQMAPKTEDFLVEDTHFWVVRPRVSGASVTGLSTLISGAYVGMEIGSSKKSRRSFVGLETEPIVTTDVPGRYFVLKAHDLGSLDRGTPLYFRRLQVGQVVSYDLDEGGKSLTIKVFVKAPYDQYVNPDTRFWEASGIDLSLSASGLDVQTQSILSILVGGIAFETPASDPVLPPADANTTFKLFDNRAAAFMPAARDPQDYVVVFKQSVRGLEPGAPVEFRGIRLGQVVDVTAQVDAKTFEFSSPVTIRLEAERLGLQVRDLPPGADLPALRRQLIDSLVAHGVRAQLRSGNLLTGSLFVTFDFFPDAPKTQIDWSQHPVRLPTVPGQFEGLEQRVNSIVKKLDSVDFKGISDDLQKAIEDLDKTLVSARDTLDSADRLVQPDSELGVELGATLQEVSRAARSLRVLTDYLERHPESLIRGKEGGPK
jgi:paraquat-inducible protein B